MSSVSEMLVQLRSSDFLVPAVITFVILLVTTILLLVYRRLSTKPSTILLIGLNNSGKTAMFTKLIDSSSNWLSYMSMKENIFADYFTGNGQQCQLVDYPGAESLRKNLFSKWMVNAKATVRCVIFVVDSTTFTEKCKDVAELLYDVLYESKGAVPVLVACNKQDQILKAVSYKAIRDGLERELGLINVSRTAALSSTNGDSSKRLLTKTGSAFRWTDLSKTDWPAFVECCAADEKADIEKMSLNPIRGWIDSI